MLYAVSVGKLEGSTRADSSFRGACLPHTEPSSFSPGGSYRGGSYRVRQAKSKEMQ